jgi:methionyl aminopeptidase
MTPNQNDEQTQRIAAMKVGGQKLAQVRDTLVQFTAVGMTFAQIEKEAQRLIAAAGAQPNFSLVPNYHWATCVMKNDEMCHGIPAAEKIVQDGDLIKIDVGLLWDGYNLDTTATLIAGNATAPKLQFLEVGKKALDRAIAQAIAGNSVYDVSFAMQKIVERAGCGMVYQLTGHGIGRELHEDPAIPCVAVRRDKRSILRAGQTVAIEVMYAMGNAFLVLDNDGWTYRTADRSLSGMIEETVLVTENGPEVLTR